MKTGISVNFEWSTQNFDRKSVRNQLKILFTSSKLQFYLLFTYHVWSNQICARLSCESSSMDRSFWATPKHHVSESLITIRLYFQFSFSILSQLEIQRNSEFQDWMKHLTESTTSTHLLTAQHILIAFSFSVASSLFTVKSQRSLHNNTTVNQFTKFSSSLRKDLNIKMFASFTDWARKLFANFLTILFNWIGLKPRGEIE